MNMLPGSSCGDCTLPDIGLGMDWLYAGGDPALIGQSLLVEPGELTPGSGLASSCGPGAKVGLKDRSVMLWGLRLWFAVLAVFLTGIGKVDLITQPPHRPLSLFQPLRRHSIHSTCC